MHNPQSSQDTWSFISLVFYEVIQISVAIGLYVLFQRSFKRLLDRYQDDKDAFAGTIVSSAPIIDIFAKVVLIVTLLHLSLGDLVHYFPFRTKEIVQLVLLMLTGLLVYYFINNSQERLLKEQTSKFDATAIQTFAKIAKLGIFTVVGFAVLPILGIETSGLLTLGAVSSVVLGLASKDWLSNFFGGLMIFIDKPFGVGDWIKCEEKGIEGTVMSIGWRLTCIRTFERRPLYVPNSFFAQTSIENPSRMENRRIKHFINLPYKDFDKIPMILEDIRTMLKTSDDVDQSRPIYVHITQLAATSVECMVYCFTKYTDWENFLNAQQHVMLGILKILHQNETSYGIPMSQVIIQHVDS